MPNFRVVGSWLLLAFAALSCSDSSEGSGLPQTMVPPGTAGSAGPATPAVEGVVHVSTGDVQGDVVDGTRRYLKIPFAKPPVGDLRWRSPQKPDAWTGVRHEPELSKACSQNMSSGSMASLNEDCLYLNVWQPLMPPTAAPVMVWIHGGGNFGGGTNDVVPTSDDKLWFDGHVFAQRHGIVVVTLNYRLGPLGFFAHPDLAAEGSNVGNQGLLDQNLALQWVKENIAAFGGNPNNVTIFGESAGSSDVCTHVASPKSAGLFHRAVSQSGGCTAALGSAMTLQAAAAPVMAFAKAVGCESPTGQLACMRQKPIDLVMQNAMQPDPMKDAAGTTLRFSVVVDGPGGFLPKSPREIFDAGELNRVPYILGSNNDEGALFLISTAGPTTDAEYQAQLQMRYPAIAAPLAMVYPPSAYGGNPRKALERVVGDSGLVCGTHDSARRAAKAGLTVYSYNFNVPWAIAGGTLGATHAAEISHVFGVPFMPDPASQAVSDAMNSYWANFAKTGDPNFAGAPAIWPKFAPTPADSDQRLQLDSTWMVLTDFRKPECAFWRQQYEAGE